MFFFISSINYEPFTVLNGRGNTCYFNTLCIESNVLNKLYEIHVYITKFTFKFSSLFDYLGRFRKFPEAFSTGTTLQFLFNYLLHFFLHTCVSESGLGGLFIDPPLYYVHEEPSPCKIHGYQKLYHMIL